MITTLQDMNADFAGNKLIQRDAPKCKNASITIVKEKYANNAERSLYKEMTHLQDHQVVHSTLDNQ
jgi:hypothetical protein